MKILQFNVEGFFYLISGCHSSNLNLSFSIIKRLPFLIQYPLPFYMPNGNSFGVVEKAIEEVTDLFIGFTEEVLAFLTVRFVIPAGIVILCHDL